MKMLKMILLLLWVIALLGGLVFSTHMVRLADPDLSGSTKDFDDAKRRQDDAKSARAKLGIDAETEAKDAQKALVAAEDRKAGLLRENPTKAGEADPAIVRTSKLWSIAREKVSEIGRSAAARRLDELVAAANEDSARAAEALTVARRKVARAAWYLWAFVFGASGAATLIIFNRFILLRTVDEDPFAILALTFAGGIAGLMVVTYAADKWDLFKGIDTDGARTGRIIGIAIATGLAWDVVVRVTRRFFRRYPTTQISI